jgi:hypothetical protein
MGTSASCIASCPCSKLIYEKAVRLDQQFMHKIIRLRPIFLVLIILTSLAIVGNFNKKSYSLSLSSVSVTLSNSRLSFKGALASGNNVGATYAYINTTQGAYPSTSASQLVEGDVVRIGASSTMGSYTIASTSAHNLIYLTSTLASGNATTGNDVISTASSNLTTRFTTANAIPNGRFRILIPADATAARATDGIPDVDRFDGGFNGSAPNIAATVTCPADVGSTYDFVTGVATRSSTTIAGITYHSFECAYSGAGALGSDFDGGLVAGGINANPFTINNLINPAPSATHTIGVADTPRIIIQHLDATLQVVDQTTVAIGLIEAVKVTASVSPQITFRILPVPGGTGSVCGATTTVTTLPNLVPLGELLIGTFTNAAQSLSVSTNAVGGYSVTVLANDQLGRNGGPGDLCDGDPGDTTPADGRTENTSCIPDTIGNAGNMSHTASSEWGSTTFKGFAYSLHNVNSVSGMTTAFQFNTNGGNCNGGGNCFRQFADAENSETAQELISSTAPAENHNAYICYRAVIGSIQAAGDYENFLTFTATSRF